MSLNTKIKIRYRGRPLSIGQVYVLTQKDLALLNKYGGLLAGQLVLYCEYKRMDDFYSYQTKTYGVDKAAWDEAVKQGVRFLLYYAKRERKMVIVAREQVGLSPVVSMGRGMQYRISERRATQLLAASPMKPGKPDMSVTVEVEE